LLAVFKSLLYTLDEFLSGTQSIPAGYN
jgi:hypothetical protein